MDYFVSHACNLPPWYLWVFLSNRSRNVLGSFANNFDCPYYCKLRFNLLKELLIGHAVDKFLCLYHAIKDVIYIVKNRSFHMFTTSFSICFPITGLRASFITKSTFIFKMSLKKFSISKNVRRPGTSSNSTSISTSLFFFCLPRT